MHFFKRLRSNFTIKNTYTKAFILYDNLLFSKYFICFENINVLRCTQYRVYIHQ